MKNVPNSYQPALIAVDGDADEPWVPGSPLERTFGITIRAIDEEKRSVEVVASTAAVDSYDEIVEQDWDLKRFKANPVVLWNHNRGSMFAADPSAALPIGSATKCRVEDGQLVATLCFVDAAANPLAEKVWQGFRQGSLRAVSVGFLPSDVRMEIRDGQEIYVLRGNELHEISAVPVGANPEAVARARASQREQLRTLASGGASKNPPKEKTMNILVMLAAVLGLTSTASESDVTEAARKAKNAADRVPDLEAGARTLADRVKTLETENTAQKAQNATLVIERDAAQKRAEGAEERALDVELKSMVGDKLEPCEVETVVNDKTVPGPMAKLAKSNRPLFDEMMAQRSSKKGELGRKSMLDSHKSEVGARATGVQSLDDIESEIEKVSA